MRAKTTSPNPQRWVRKSVACGVSAAALAGGLTASVASTASAQGIPKLSYSGTITMYAANYNPQIKGVTPPPGSIDRPRDGSRRGCVRKDVPQYQNPVRARKRRDRDRPVLHLGVGRRGAARCR